ncbi:hypothetical protein FB645_002826 [Coemansia sp. IMI 203386]|nr:hypothetical protein FB645_002826 [Coemansia sp. IMI 203386]
MKLLSSFAKTLALGTCLIQAVQALAVNTTIIRRDVTSSNIINDFHGSVLILGSLQTSCEVALLDSQNGFVAASCFIFKSTGKVDNSQDFKVSVYDPSSGSTKIQSLTRIDVHPKYDPSTLANNIAIIGFGTDGSNSWDAHAAGHRSEWDNIFFTYRAMINPSKKTWSPTSVASLGINSGCASASNLYKSNSDWMLCVTQAPTSLANSACLLPYGVAWGIYQPNDLAVAAIYSHSVITSDSLCQSSGTQYHIYTMLQPYIAWGSGVAGRSLNTYWQDGSYSYSGSRSFSMTNSGGSSISGSKIVSGDYYPMQRVYKPVSVPTPQPAPDTGSGSGSSGSGNTSSGSGSTNTGNNNSGSTNTGNTNTGNTNTGNTNTGSTNTGNTNTGSTNTGNSDSGSDSGSSNSGSGSSGSGSNSGSDSGSSNSGSDNGGSSGSGSNSGSSDNGNNNNSGGSSSSNNDDGDNKNSSSNSSSRNSSSDKNNSASSNSSGDNDDDNDIGFEEGELVTINGTVVAIADLMTDTNESNIELTHVYYMTRTDANGNVIVVSDVEVETYAYSDYLLEDDSDGATGSNAKNDQFKASESNDGDGLSRSATIAIGVVVPLVTILILIGLFFLHKWWRRRLNASTWDPKNENADIDRRGIMEEVSASDLETLQPPANAEAPLEDVVIAGDQPVDRTQRETLPPTYTDHNFANIPHPVEKLVITSVTDN